MDEEVPKKDPSSDDQVNTIEARNVRSYDCVFCKRGFSSAQALGGHMNIHRRDRARIRDSNTSPMQSSSSPPVVVMMAEGNVRPDHDEEMYIFGGSPTSKFNINHQDIRSFFPMGSEDQPSIVRPCHLPMHKITPAMVEEERRQELIRYGKELELGLKYRSVGGEDQDGGGEEKNGDKDEGGVNLNLGL